MGEDAKGNSAYSNTAGSAGFGQGANLNPHNDGPINDMNHLNIEVKENLEENGQDSNGGYKNRRMVKKKKV